MSMGTTAAVDVGPLKTDRFVGGIRVRSYNNIVKRSLWIKSDRNDSNDDELIGDILSTFYWRSKSDFKYLCFLVRQCYRFRSQRLYTNAVAIFRSLFFTFNQIVQKPVFIAHFFINNT